MKSHLIEFRPFFALLGRWMRLSGALLSFFGIICISPYCFAQCETQGHPMGWGAMAPPFITAGLTNIVAGYDHCLGIQSDTSVVGWGNNDNGQSTTAGLNSVTAVAVGRECSLAVSNGLLIAWGDTNSLETTVPSIANPIVAIAAGADFGLAVDNSGNVIAWGDNCSGETNF
jgi:alpha-tubulin suppressor-like RCC1 family protein